MNSISATYRRLRRDRLDGQILVPIFTAKLLHYRLLCHRCLETRKITPSIASLAVVALGAMDPACLEVNVLIS